MSEVSEPELSFDATEPNSVRYYESRHQLIETNLDTLSVSLTASVVSMKKHQDGVDSQPVSASTTPLPHTPTPPLGVPPGLSYPDKTSEKSHLISASQVQPRSIPISDQPQKISEEFQFKKLENGNGVNVNNGSVAENENPGRLTRFEDTCCEIVVFFSECCMCYGNKG